jgi:stage III sporulation protein AB
MILILIALCTYVGYGFSRYYINRFEFIKKFRFFLSAITLDINFSHQKLATMIEQHKTQSKELNKLLKNFLACLDKKKLDDDTLFNSIKLLKDDEKQTIAKFFASLGRFDVENQTKHIQNFDAITENWQNAAEQDKNRFAPLFVKLGIIVGVMISLILL